MTRTKAVYKESLTPYKEGLTPYTKRPGEHNRTQPRLGDCVTPCIKPTAHFHLQGGSLNMINIGKIQYYVFDYSFRARLFELAAAPSGEAAADDICFVMQLKQHAKPLFFHARHCTPRRSRQWLIEEAHTLCFMSH